MRKLNQRSDTYNPLDFVDAKDPLALDECRDLAEAVVERTGEEKDPHWSDSAEETIGSIAAMVVYYGKKEDGTRSLSAVKYVISHPEKWELAKKVMQESDAWGGMLARKGGVLEHFKGDELGSVLSTTNRFLRWLDTPTVAENTARSSFDPADLKKGKRKTDIFLVLPAAHQRPLAPLLRCWIQGLLRACVKTGPGERNLVHFILDDAATLGHMQALDDAVDKYRGYGVRLIFIYQSIGQLRKCWPADGGATLEANCSAAYFGVKDYVTAEAISKRLGISTQVIEEGGDNRSYSSQTSFTANQNSSTHSAGRSRSFRYHGKELAKPDEILRMHPRLCITFPGNGMAAVLTWLLRSYEQPAWLWQQPGWLGGIQDAFRTLVISSMHFVVAAACAALLTAIILQSRPYEREVFDGGTATRFSEPAVRSDQGKSKQRTGANRKGVETPSKRRGP